MRIPSVRVFYIHLRKVEQGQQTESHVLDMMKERDHRFRILSFGCNLCAFKVSFYSETTTLQTCLLLDVTAMKAIPNERTYYVIVVGNGQSNAHAVYRSGLKPTLGSPVSQGTVA